MDLDISTDSNVIKNKVLVVGNLDQTSLVQKIFKHSSCDWIDFFEGKCSKRVLDNKYYTAELEFIVFDSSSLHLAPQSLAKFSQEVDALILGFDSSKENILNALNQSWIAEWIDEYQPNVLLALTEADVESEDLNADVREWCFDQGMELVDIRDLGISATPANQVAEDVSSGTPERSSLAFFEREDRVGFDRVLEAIESHSWSNMQLKPQDRKPNVSSSSNQPIPINSKPGLTAPAPSPSSYSNSQEIAGLMKMFSAVTMRNEAADLSELQMEHQMQDFESTLLSLRSMRDRAQAMPDEQRREFAARVALSFMKSLGEDLEDDEDGIAALAALHDDHEL